MAGPYLYLHPTKPGVFVSRQRIYQLRNLAAGCCERCGRFQKEQARLCARCAKKRKAYERRRGAA